MNQLKIYIICILSFFLSIFIVSCSTKHISFNKKEVNIISVFLEPDSSNGLVEPARIKAVPDGLLIYDLGIHKICQFNLKGQRLLCFGRQGKGPGEYSHVNGMWKFRNKYLVYDRLDQKLIIYNLKGKHVEDIPVKLAGQSRMLPFKIEALSSELLIIPSGGENQSLLKWVNIKTDSTGYLGRMDKVPEFIRHASPKFLKALGFNESKNYKMTYGANQSGIFILHDLTGQIEKYTISGKVLWRKNIKVPALQNLLQQIIQKDNKRLKERRALIPLTYFGNMSINEKGAAVLLYVPEKQPVTVVWIPNNGGRITVVTFSSLKNHFPLFEDFTVARNNHYIYFLNFTDGKIFRTKWSM